MTKSFIRAILLMALTIIVACSAKSDRSKGGRAELTLTPMAPQTMNTGGTTSTTTGGDTDAYSSDGPGSGNGGKGVLIDGKPYLLDLVEAGLERTPFVNNEVKMSTVIRDRLKKSLGHDPAFPVDLIAQKLTEIMKIEFAYGLLILKTIENFEWRLVSLPVKRVEDQREGVEVKPEEYVQIAKRLHHAIIFDKKWYPEMDEWNRAATVFHEAIYAFAKPIKLSSGFYTQDTGAVQEFTAVLFSPRIDENNLIHRVVARIFPQEMRMGDGHLMKDNRPDQIAISPDIFFTFRTIKQLNDDKVPHVYDSTSLFFLSGEESIKNLREDAVEAICKKVPADNQHMLFAEAAVPYKDLFVDFYEGAEGKFYSYLKVKDHMGDESVIPGGPSEVITAANCTEYAGSMFDRLAAKIQSGFKVTHELYGLEKPD